MTKLGIANSRFPIPPTDKNLLLGFSEEFDNIE